MGNKVRFLGEEIEEGGSEMIVREENSAAHKAWSGGSSPSFNRALAFHLRYSKEHSKRERVVVNSREEIAALQDWLSQNKLSFILDNIQRAGVRSLLDLVELSAEALAECATDIQDRITLQIAVANKRNDMFPNYKAPQLIQWWVAARAPKAQIHYKVIPPRKELSVCVASNSTSLLLVRNLGPGATSRSVRRALMQASSKQILAVYIYFCVAPPTIFGKSIDLACFLSPAKLTASAIVECYQHDAAHVVACCNGMEIQGQHTGETLKVQLVDLKRRSPKEDIHVREKDREKSKKLRSWLNIVKTEEARLKESPLDPVLYARWREARRQLDQARFAQRRTPHRDEVSRRPQIPHEFKPTHNKMQFKVKNDPRRPWREPLPTPKSRTSSSGLYLGCYFMALERRAQPLSRPAWGAGRLNFDDCRHFDDRLVNRARWQHRSEGEVEVQAACDKGGVGFDCVQEALSVSRERERRRRKYMQVPQRMERQEAEAAAAALQRGKKEYRRRLQLYLEQMHEEGTLNECNYALAVSIFHAGNCGLLQGLQGEMKCKVPQYATPPMLGAGDKSARATRKKKQAGVLSGSDGSGCGSGRGGESVGEMMRRRRLTLHAVESSPDFDIGVFKRLLTVVEQALDAGRVLRIMGEPVPKMMCDLSQIREVCVCPNTKTAKKALSVCNGLSEVRKNVVNRVSAIRLGENVVEKRPADDKEDHDTRVVAGTDTVDDKLRIRECTTTCERTRVFRVQGIASLVEKQRMLELQFKQDLQHDKACWSSPQSVKDGRADTNRIDKWCKVWAKQRMPRATRAQASAPLSAATIDLLQSSGATLRPNAHTEIALSTHIEEGLENLQGRVEMDFKSGVKSHVRNSPQQKRQANLKAATEEAGKKERIEELNGMLERSGALAPPLMQEMKQLLKEEYKKHLWTAHTRAVRDAGRGFAMSHVSLCWDLSLAAMKKLKEKVSTQELKDIEQNLEVSLDVEVPFEEQLEKLCCHLKPVLMLLTQTRKRDAGGANPDKQKEVEQEERRWLQVKEALQGFSYEHPRSGRRKTVTDEESYNGMLEELSREAEKSLNGIARPLLMAEPILSDIFWMQVQLTK